MLASGDQISHYRIVSTLGAGGMGEVYLADDTKLERRVALKVLLPEVSDDEERVRRFMQEARAASALNHPNILTVFEIGASNDLQYIATEFIQGQTLRDRIKGEPMRLRETLDITLQIAAALAAAHEAGIIHRDIKPENIMIREDGIVKVLDFGLAKLSVTPTAGIETTLPQINTQPGVLIGTVAYMSPEQARGRKLDHRSDIFSLGIVMFELFTGKRPFEGENHLDLVSSILKDDAPGLRQAAPDLPRELERIVEKSLRKDRDQRYQNVKDLYIDIGDLKEDLKFAAKLNQSVQPTKAGEALFTNPSDIRSAFRTGVSKTRRFTLLHAFIFTAVMACLAGAFWYFRAGRETAAAVPGTYKTVEVATWNSAAGELFSSAKFSPDGKMIAFSSTRSGMRSIWVTQTGSTESIQVTKDPFANSEPLWSPKGDEIAFLSDRGTSSAANNATGIWRVNALGGTPRLIGSLPMKSAGLRRWTASGKIYFESGKNLYAMEVSTGIAQEVRDLGAANISLVNLSADERSMVYAVREEKTWRIMKTDLVGGEPTQIVKGDGIIESLVWVPNKNRIFYGASSNGTIQTFASEIGSGTSFRITAAESDNNVVDAAPDGRSVLASSAKEESNLWRVNITDKQQTLLARDLNAKLFPSISPDNQRMVFQSVKNFSQGNRIFDSALVVKQLTLADDGENTTALSEHASLPSWSPNGSHVAYIKQSDSLNEIFIVNPKGGGERKLTSGGVTMPGYAVSPYNLTDTQTFAWSPGGKVTYISRKSGADNIWTVDLDNGLESPMTNNTDPDLNLSSPMWSRNGHMIAVSFFRKSGSEGERPVRGAMIFNRETDEFTRAYESTKANRLVGWTEEGTSLVLAETETITVLAPTMKLIKISTSNGSENTIAELKNIYYYNIFLTDDEKVIAFAARTDDRDDLWVMPTTGGPARRVTDNNDSGSYFSRLAWFHDGTAIAFGKQTRFSLLSMITDID